MKQLDSETHHACAPKVLICATGSVAGIKVAEIVNALKARGAETRVVCTDHGGVFLKQPQNGKAVPEHYTDADDYHVRGNSTEPPCSSEQLLRPVPLHISLSEWADVLLFAPLSANTLAKLSAGLCDNLCCRCFRAWDVLRRPVVLAPAMNTKMWAHPATAAHVAAVARLGRVAVVQPVVKLLACGDVGVGAMAAVDDIVASTLGALEGGLAVQGALAAQDAGQDGAEDAVQDGAQDAAQDPGRGVAPQSEHGATKGERSQCCNGGTRKTCGSGDGGEGQRGGPKRQLSTDRCAKHVEAKAAKAGEVK